MACVYQIPDLVQGVVVKRPSKHCKTPYVADVCLEDGTEVMAHTAALGCSGHADAGAIVLMKPVNNPKNVCKYKILMVKETERGVERIMGIDPKMAETLTEECLKQNCISSLKNVVSYGREKKRLNSRFDFMGIDKDNKEFIMEVKNVPLADYVDCLAKEKKHMDFSNCNINEKISYFPDGYRKKQKDTVSPRALKHIHELEQIVESGNMRCIMCYVIQRTDSNRFQPSKIDPIYRNAVQNAVKKGVEIITLQISWDNQGNAHFIRDDLPIHVFDN